MYGTALNSHVTAAWMCIMSINLCPFLATLSLGERKNSMVNWSRWMQQFSNLMFSRKALFNHSGMQPCFIMQQKLRARLLHMWQYTTNTSQEANWDLPKLYKNLKCFLYSMIHNKTTTHTEGDNKFLRLTGAQNNALLLTEYYGIQPRCCW